ncbi:MAG: LUD domain-containing protein [Candidatus Paceibacterota bacterium]|jgi:hypothetical protein
MEINEKFGILANEESIRRTVEALIKNGFRAEVAENSEATRKRVLEILPAGAEVMTMTSVTLDTLGISKEINESGRFNSIRGKFTQMDQKTQGSEMRKLGAGPDWVLGSVHAVTEEGEVVVASATGSQLPAYAYGAGKVVWVVGAQKIVKNLEEGMQRIREYTLPLEDERAQKFYGVHSSLNKWLIFEKEGNADRITIIIIKEKLGF